MSIRRVIRAVCILTFLSVISIPAGSVHAADSPKTVVSKYVKAIIDGRWEEAESYWSPEAIAQSQRLGMSYPGTYNKYDCNAPVFFMRDSIRAGSADYSIRYGSKSFDWREVEVTYKFKVTLRIIWWGGITNLKTFTR